MATSTIKKDINMRIYEGISFTFSNSQYSTVDVSDIDSRISNAKYIGIFNTQSAVPILANLNSSKTTIQATVLASRNDTLRTNILAIY